VPTDRPEPGSTEEWLLRARADLALANAPLPPGGVLEDLCYHAQQAAEKALKAISVHHGWAFRYVHDLDVLVTDLEHNGLRAPDRVRASLVLTEYAHQTRYPGSNEPVTEAERRHAVELARAVVEWAAQTVEER
jgi:HEPN domain-containing protein